MMRKLFCAVVAAIAGLAMLSQSAQAQSRVVIGPFDLGDSRLFLAGAIAGGGMLGTYYAIRSYEPLRLRGDTSNFSTGAFALTAVGCMTLSPMIASFLVWQTEGRYLTHREALGLGTDCIIPVIGSWLWNAAYAAHPEWPGR